MTAYQAHRGETDDAPQAAECAALFRPTVSHRANGGRSRTRTYGPLIKSQLLYQLSYAPAGRTERLGAYSKHAPDCKGRRLTHAHPGAHVSPRQTAGRPLPAGLARWSEESPGSTGIRCRPTAGGGDPRDSATENKPPAHPRFARKGLPEDPRARVKRCGKSAPRPWQQGRQGKPHREQDRIGAAGGMGRSPTSPRGRGGVPASSSGLVA